MFVCVHNYVCAYKTCIHILQLLTPHILSVLCYLQPSRGASSGSEKESKEQGKVQETSPSLQEMSPRLKKHRSGFV